MKRFVCIGLLVVTGCASTNSLPVEATAAPAPVVVVDEGGDDLVGIQTWIPGIFYDLYDIFDAHIGSGYGFGVHVKATELARVGIFDHADFSVLGIDKGIFNGEYTVPPMNQKEDVWVLSAKFGIGFGAGFQADIWEVIDFVSSVVGFGYWSLDED